MRIDQDGLSWLYSMTCGITVSCEDQIIFDATNRTVTFNNVTVQPAIGQDSQSTAPLTMNGTLVWTAADE
ncbi:MAG: hypothetical protein V3T17_09115 [Pseudomonadales bacterium]